MLLHLQQQQMAMLMALMSGRNPQNRGEEEKKQNCLVVCLIF